MTSFIESVKFFVDDKHRGEALQNAARRNPNKKDENAISTSLIIDDKNDIFAEQIYDKGLNKSAYAVYHPRKDKIEYASTVDIGGIQYVPITDEEVNKCAILLPSNVLEYETEEALDQDILSFIKRWLDIPDDHRLFALWNIKRSWVYERFHTLNYLRALGDTGLGKTRYLDTLGSIHYKPILTSGATTAAPVFRVIDKWSGTMIFDEADIKITEETEVIIKIINQGYERGKHIMRCEQNDASKINFFDPYCPKVLATRRPFADKAVESRCITQFMTGTARRDIPRNLDDRFFAEAERLRNKLLMWRFKNYHRINPNPDVRFNSENLEPRVEQISTTFLSLFANQPDQLKTFENFLRNYQETLIQERQDTPEGEIVSAIHDLLEEGMTDITSKDIMLKGEPTDNNGKPLTPKGISNRLKSLGFGRSQLVRNGSQVKRCILLENAHLANLFNRYGVTVVTVLRGTGDPQKKLENEPIPPPLIERYNRYNVTGDVEPSDDDVVGFVYEKNPIGYLVSEFVEKYGQATLDRLLASGRVIELPRGWLRCV